MPPVIHPVQTALPTIDIEGLLEGTPKAVSRVAADLRGPCSDFGIFHITSHGMTHPELDEFECAMHAFFGSSESEKQSVRRSRDNAWGYYDEELTKNRRDWKEVFDYGAERGPGHPEPAHSDGLNRWPTLQSSSLPDLKPILLRHFASCERIGLALLRAIAVSLGLAPDRFDTYFRGHSSFVRLNRYPPCPEPAPADADLFPERGHLGVHHHTDAGALTILYQDRVASLQAWLGDRFVLVEPVREALTVNLGDMLQVWSNDRYRSPLHRVLAHPDRTRYSAPFFLNPRYDTICEPLLDAAGSDPPSGQFAGIARPARFRPISWAHFRDQRSAGDYADYGAEIQIDDYRINER